MLEYYTLQILSFSLDVTPKEIAVKLSLPKSSVTYIIDSLEKRGLVKRKLDTRDRRSWLVFLTDKGEKMLKRIFTHKSELLMPVFSKFSDDEKIYWDKFINNIIESFENKSKK
ncbi:MAG: MarR family transcriptional regulator [Actinobacteria bacterium]|nr:MarR family transcriptional regulator [Actinomycetota bacterium]